MSLKANASMYVVGVGIFVYILMLVYQTIVASMKKIASSIEICFFMMKRH